LWGITKCHSVFSSSSPSCFSVLSFSQLFIPSVSPFDTKKFCCFNEFL
jgi:hypothetical protein